MACPLGKLPRLTLDSASKFSKSNFTRLPHAPLSTIPSPFLETPQSSSILPAIAPPLT